MSARPDGRLEWDADRPAVDDLEAYWAEEQAEIEAAEHDDDAETAE